MLKDLEQAIILDPTHTSALNNLGFHYLNIEKEYDKAVYYLTEIINLKYDANAYYNRAKAFQFLKKYSEAISDINLIIKNEGEDKQLIQMRGHLHFMNGDIKSFDRDIEKSEGL
jgi:tetratricopeptide (TPR) repeat protein